MARKRTRRAERRAGVERPSHEAFTPGETALIESQRAGAYTRWQDAHQGKPVSGTPKVQPLIWTLPRMTERVAAPVIYTPVFAPKAGDTRAPRPAQPFAKTIRKCEPAGPHHTSTGFNTRL